MNTFVDVAHSHAEVAIVFCLFQKSPFVLVQALYYALILYTEEVFIRRILNAFVIGDFNQIIRFIVRVLVFSVLLHYSILQVFTSVDPSQVTDSVVRLVLVDVVDFRQAVRVGDEVFGKNAMVWIRSLVQTHLIISRSFAY